MGDRTRGYVPDGTSLGLEPHYSTLVGKPGYPQTEMPVALGLEDQLNRTAYQEWARVPGDVEHWSKFEGHRVRIGVQLVTYNRREVNDWKGRDEIRSEGEWLLTFNEQVVFGDEGRFSDPLETLLRIRSVIQKLQQLPFEWRQPGSTYRGQIEGRKVFYYDEPAVIRNWIPEQGCVWLAPDGMAEFKTPCWNQGEDSIPLERDGAKDPITSPHIWWHRD